MGEERYKGKRGKRKEEKVGVEREKREGNGIEGQGTEPYQC